MNRPCLSFACVLLLSSLSGISEAQDRKLPSYKGAFSAPAPPPLQTFTDVPEAEPNNGPTTAQSFACGDALRPATLTNAAARDSDWIAFTANAGDLITFATREDVAGPETDTVINLIASDGTTSLAVNDDDGSSQYSRIDNFAAPYTGVYYGRIRGFNGAEGPYRADVVCTPAPQAPANDVCANATLIGYGPIDLSGSTLAAANDYDLCPGTPECPASCTGFNSPGRDVVYRIEAGGSTVLDVTYTVSPSTADASIYLVGDCSNVAGTCVAGTDTQTGQPSEHLSIDLPSPGTYYLILDAFTPNGGGAWTLVGDMAIYNPTHKLSWGALKTIYR